MPPLHYCTIYDQHFLSRGIAMYHSLTRRCDECTLIVFCLDDIAYEALRSLGYARMLLVKLEEFETQELLDVKQLRSRGEYCWTCTPSIIKQSIMRFNLEKVVYLDADLYFFGSPECLIEEWANSEKSILLTEHRYTERYDQGHRFGKFCVQFVGFKADKVGLSALDWWIERCLEWCFARDEGGKFGDQKYLDDWVNRFESVHIMEHLGGGVAPWNVQQYNFCERRKNFVQLVEKKTAMKFALIFFHFHGFRFYSNGIVDFSNYQLDGEMKKNIYEFYLSELRLAAAKVAGLVCPMTSHGIIDTNTTFKGLIIYLKGMISRRVRGTLNVQKIKWPEIMKN
jgi:hypothetical protein